MTKFNLSIDLFTENAMDAADLAKALHGGVDQLANAAARESSSQPWSPYTCSGKIYGVHKRVIGTWNVDPEVTASLTITAENDPDSRVHCASCGGHIRAPQPPQPLSRYFGVPSVVVDLCTTCAPTTATANDRRRIGDGARALALPDPQNSDEIRAQLSIIYDGMAALQSLDDLGKEGNHRAYANLRKLEKRYDALKVRLEKSP